ncbi:MAG: M15 family metallopeptidase [Jatrophihabitans sp.]|uniref:M15 family metallopeptidase n=1 Tax=Jatrophihabitans sp. TaxID=1932789 RepID=UPI003F818AAC
MRRIATVLTLLLAAACSSHPAAPTPSGSVAPPRHAPSAAARATAGQTSAAPRTAAAAAMSIPPVSAKARAAGLIDVRTVVPDAVVDLHYATTHNFTHQQLYPSRARCLVHRTMAPGLRAAAAVLRRQGLVLVFWDCYRPHAVQVRMFRIVPNPTWVAQPGPYATSHESGRSVDVTLARRAVGGTCPHKVRQHCQLIMGTAFDDFTPRAYAFATNGIGAVALRNRTTLRHAMETDGLAVYSGEWWHFDGPGSFVHRPILDAPPY